MEKINVVYWSQSGNTEKMAQAIGKGIGEGGKEAVVTDVSSASIDDIKASNVIALGCPAMGCETLEESEMEPFMCDIEGNLSGKNILLFGSYGWGDGQWMRDWQERVENAGAKVINGEGIICQETPDDSVLQQCMEAGKTISAI